MSTSEYFTPAGSPATESTSPCTPRSRSGSASERNLSPNSLHYYSTDDDNTANSEPSKLIPIRTVISSLQEYTESLGIGSEEETAIFPCRLGDPTQIPLASANACFPRSGPHRWFGANRTERAHPLHGKVFSLYYGPHFRKPKEGWTGNERVDWLRYLWDWRPAKDHAEHTFESWSATPRAEEFWKRRLRDKACEYYVQDGTVQGTVLEEREVEPKAQEEGPTNEFEPDVYCLRNYLRRIELGQDYYDDEGEAQDGVEQQFAAVEIDQGKRRSPDRSEVSSEATESISSSRKEKMRARRLERQVKGIKAPPSSLRDPTPDAPKVHERRQSRLQFLKSALAAAWASATSVDEGPAEGQQSMPASSGSQRSPSSSSLAGQSLSVSGRSGPSGEIKSPGPSTGRRRQRPADSAPANWPFQ